MEEKDIFDILNSYKEAIDLLLEKVDGVVKEVHDVEERVNALESMIYDEILEPTRQAMDAQAKEERFNDFNDKYGEKLGAYDKVLGAAEGNPEFSLSRSAFDEYEKLPEPRPEAEAFVEELVKTVDGQIDDIKSSLGLAPDAEVVVTQDENGDTTVEADGEVVAEEKDGEVVTSDGTVAPAEEDANEEQGELDFGDEEEDDPEEVKKYEEELAKQFQ